MAASNDESAEHEPDRIVVSNSISGGSVKGVQAGSVRGNVNFLGEHAAERPAQAARMWLPPPSRRWTPEPNDLVVFNAAVNEVLDGDHKTPLLVILGPGEMGKTQLPLHWAHRNPDLFDGGYFFGDAGPVVLGNGQERAASVVDIAGEWLTRLGAQPVAGEARLEQWGYYTDHRPRAFTLLDDVCSVGQAVSLLHRGLMVVTSRRPLEALAHWGARYLAYEEHGWVRVQ